MLEAQNSHRQILKEKIDNARKSKIQLRRSKADTDVVLKSKRKERSPLRAEVAVPTSLRRGSRDGSPSSVAVVPGARGFRRAGSFDPSTLGLRLSETRRQKKDERTQLDARKSMKEMDPSKIISMLENLAATDGDQADECLQVLKNSTPSRGMPRRTKSTESKSRSALSA